jgi:hypothetical protein
MRMILNGINGRYLREITENMANGTEVVEAAVAYATDESLLFEYCWNRQIPLRYWGRFDETIPVNLGILRSFLARRSPNFTCKLLRHFHAKVIWWHGVGAYVGSANLSNAAWYNNIEAGCFFDEAEMAASGMDIQLRSFFRRVDENSSPLSEELYRAIESRSRELQRSSEQDRERRQKFLSVTSVKGWKGLLREGQRTASDRQRQEFLGEWYETLQILRDIGAAIAQDDRRPSWLPSDVPAGAQADQFLHAHYYNHVIEEGRRSKFAEQFEENKGNPSRALQQAENWWRALTASPTGEQQMLIEWAPFLCEMLSPDRLLLLTESEFEGVCERVWSIQDHARRVANTTLNLAEGKPYKMAAKTHALAKFLYERHAQNGSNVLEVIYHVLYGGRDEDVPLRLWEATTDSPWRIDHLGISALGELIGWALPDKFPPRNNRTSKALRSLGFPVSVHG